jgi:hypothetical protein
MSQPPPRIRLQKIRGLSQPRTMPAYYRRQWQQQALRQ